MLIKFGDFEFYEINIIMLPRHSARQNMATTKKFVMLTLILITSFVKNRVQQTQAHSLSEVLCDIAWFGIELILC